MGNKEKVAALWAEYEPRIAEARRRDSDAVAVSFVDLHEERILDLPAVVLTIERYLILEQAGIFDGSCGDANPVLLFLWIVSPDFVPDPKPAKRFFRKHRKLDFTDYARAIEDYVSHIFAGAGGGKESESGKGSGSGDWVASIVDMIASEYGWTESKIFKIPIPRLFKYAHRIRLRKGSDPVSFSKEADRLQAEFIEKANEKEGA